MLLNHVAAGIAFKHNTDKFHGHICQDALTLDCWFCSQVTRTDANVLLSLDPEDLTVTNKLNYTSILPEAKVHHKHRPSPAHAPLAPIACPCRQLACMTTVISTKQKTRSHSLTVIMGGSMVKSSVLNNNHKARSGSFILEL